MAFYCIRSLADREANKLELCHEILEQMNKWDVNVNVSGGGLSGQAGAIRLGIARALIEASEDYKPKLKKQKMLTRDARVKERKKPGLRKARRARQFSKR